MPATPCSLSSFANAVECILKFALGESSVRYLHIELNMKMQSFRLATDGLLLSRCSKNKNLTILSRFCRLLVISRKDISSNWKICFGTDPTILSKIRCSFEKRTVIHVDSLFHNNRVRQSRMSQHGDSSLLAECNLLLQKYVLLYHFISWTIHFDSKPSTDVSTKATRQINADLLSSLFGTDVGSNTTVFRTNISTFAFFPIDTWYLFQNQKTILPVVLLNGDYIKGEKIKSTISSKLTKFQTVVNQNLRISTYTQRTVSPVYIASFINASGKEDYTTLRMIEQIIDRSLKELHPDICVESETKHTLIKKSAERRRHNRWDFTRQAKFSISKSQKPRNHVQHSRDIKLKIRYSNRVLHSLTEKTSLKLYRQELLRLELIGIASHKFIFAKLVKTNDEKYLVVVDQHAADERIKLEKLEKELERNPGNIIRSTALDSPFHQSLDLNTQARLLQIKEYIHSWGFRYTIRQNMIHLTHTPTVCGKHLEPQTLWAFLCRSSLPDPVHRILCSRACRSAIKFGDPLTLAQCADLLSQLSECCLPFQCAHGRPSVQPLLRL